MTERASDDSGLKDRPEGSYVPQLPGPDGQDPQETRPLWSLPAVIAPGPEARWSNPARPADAARKRAGRGFAWIGTAAAAALIAGAAFWIVADRRGEAAAVAERADATTSLARTVDALSARLSAIENNKPGDQLIELRRSIAEIRSSLASSHELSGGLAELSQRVEKLDREESAKVDKLGERVDHETSAKAAELAARIETLEKKTSATTVAAAQTPSQPGGKAPPAPPKPGLNIDTEPTGSIERPRPVLRGYIVLGARDDVALVEGRYGERAVRPGDFLPGAGRVERIARDGDAWVVVTEQGLIPPAN